MRKMIRRVNSSLSAAYLSLGFLEEILNSNLDLKLRDRLIAVLEQQKIKVMEFADIRVGDRVGLSINYMEGFAGVHGRMYLPIQRELRGTISSIKDADSFELGVLWDGEKVEHRHGPEDLTLIEK